MASVDSVPSISKPCDSTYTSNLWCETGGHRRYLDVHHGDGSQDVFYHDPDTLHISFHQDGRTLYPGTGFMDEFGGPQAIGANIDIPPPPGTGDEGLLKVMRELVLPILHRI